MTHAHDEVPHVGTSPTVRGTYGRLFPDLPPFSPPVREPRAARAWYAEFAAGRMRATPEQDADPGRDNPEIPAGYTYLGQLVAHDLTLEPRLAGRKRVDVETLGNLRTPILDLDCIYGEGPRVDPHLYQAGPDGGPTGRLRTGHAEYSRTKDNAEELDLPRVREAVVETDAAGRVIGTEPLVEVPGQELLRASGRTWARLDGARRVRDRSGRWFEVPIGRVRTLGTRALVADPRQDENLFVAQLHLALARLHNEILDGLNHLHPADAFEQARLEVRWRYQWVVLFDLLPRLVGRERVETLIATPEVSTPLTPIPARYWRQGHYLPVEVTGAALRAGHAMVRPRYRINSMITAREERAVRIFGASGRRDLRGGATLRPRWSVEWDLFLDGGEVPAQRARRFDLALSGALHDLPVASGSQMPGLAELDLLRGHALGLPSGQAIARSLGYEPVTGEELPLWPYLLEEARAETGGERLGRVGCALLAPTVVGALLADGGSFLRARSGWIPAEGEGYGLRQLVVVAREAYASLPELVF